MGGNLLRFLVWAVLAAPLCAQAALKGADMVLPPDTATTRMIENIVAEPFQFTAEGADETQPSSEQASQTACESAFEIGRSDARWTSSGRRGWYWFGWLCVSIGGIWGTFESLSAEDSLLTPPASFLIGSGIGLGIATLSAWMFTPESSLLSLRSEQSVDRECYLRGYMRTARAINVGKAAVGGLLGVGTTGLAEVVVAETTVIGVGALVIVMLLFFLGGG